MKSFVWPSGALQDSRRLHRFGHLAVSKIQIRRGTVLECLFIEYHFHTHIINENKNFYAEIPAYDVASPPSVIVMSP